jgi:hypothetical protein
LCDEEATLKAALSTSNRDGSGEQNGYSVRREHRK